MATAAEIVGRERELAALDRLLDGDGAAALVLDGEAGIGKTTVWLEGVALARTRGFRVLRCRPAESEQDLPFGALGDLLDDALEDARTALPVPQRGALDAALLRAPASGPVDRLAVSRAVYEVLRSLAHGSPLLVAVDDVHWLDSPTAFALEFALRRLDSPSARILVARRSERELPPPLGLACAPAELSLLRVGPLGLGDLDRILRARLDVRLPRPRLADLHRLSGGNPFYAFEIVRAAVARGAQAADDLVFGVPDSLGELLRQRLDALPSAGRAAVLLAAASQQPSAALVERAAGGTSDGLAEAVRAGVLAIEDGRLRFTHPLFASVAYGSAFPAERRAAHRRLAAAAGDADERAHHLALGADEPGEDVAAELERAAARAAARGVPDAAARLGESAARLTPPEHRSSAQRRLADAAGHHVSSGDPARARAILEELVASAAPGRERADLLIRLTDAIADCPEATLVAEQALAEAAGAPALSVRAYNALHLFAWLMGDLPAAVEHLREAARFAELAGDRKGLAITLGELFHAEVVLGLPLSSERVRRALELEPAIGEFPVHRSPSYQLGVAYTYLDRHDEARPLLRAELDKMRRRGQEGGSAGILYRLAELELRAGNWSEAAAAARESMTLWLQAGLDQEQACGLMMHALVQSHLGNENEARPAAETALALAEQEGDRIMATRSRGVLGFLDVSAGRPGEALEWLEPASAELRRLGVGELSIYRVVENELEALLALGRLEEAAGTIDLVEEKGRPSDRAWHQVVALRARALSAARHGETEQSVVLAERAVAACDRLPQPFEVGRTLLVQGTIERRAKRRGAAREALRRALDTFDALGAALWAERATEELARIPGRSRAQSSDLSPTEGRVAELVAEGLSNKEVAAKLFLTVRTVEWNLSKVYEKLGVRSRAELARHLSL